jgi:hypothetical protein
MAEMAAAGGDRGEALGGGVDAGRAAGTDRLADAIAESIVTAAVRQKPDALVGVEVAVHIDSVFVDGGIAAGSQPVDIDKIVRDVYRAGGYGAPWNPDPGENPRDDRPLSGGIVGRGIRHPAGSARG